MGANQSQSNTTTSTPPPVNPNFQTSIANATAPPAPPAPPTSGSSVLSTTDATLLFKELYGKDDAKKSEFRATPVVSEDGVITVDGVYSRDYLLSGVANQGHAIVQIQTGELTQKVQRPAFELAIVLDVSGSMSGAPLETAKKTIAHVVECLEDEDVLHFITYSGDSKVIFQNGRAKDKQQLLSQIRSVQATGSTNIWNGLQTATDILSQSNNGGLSSLFLFSDGHANGGGITSAPQFRANVPTLTSKGRMTISAFGIGTGFDQAVMEGIAEVGEGQYCYIAETSEIEKKVGIMLEGLTQAVATGVVLYVNGANGCSVKQAVGFTNESLLKGIPLGSLRANNTKTILLELETNVESKDDTELPIIKWDLQYHQEGANGAISLKGEISAIVTSDRSNLVLERGKVVSEVVLLEVAERDRALQDALEKERFEEALSLQRMNCNVMKSVSEECESAGLMLKAQEQQLCAMESEAPSQWNVSHMKKSTGHRRKVTTYADKASYNCL